VKDHELEDSLLQRAFTGDKLERESIYESMWQYSERFRKPVDRQVEINMAFHSGQQYVGWSTHLNGVTELKAPNHRILIVDNRLMPKVRDKVSRQLTRPGVQCIPNGTDEVDLMRARHKERILEHHDRENKLPLKQYLASMWGAIAGTCYSDVDYRPDGGAIYRDGMNEYWEGEVRTKIRGPHEVWLSPDAKIDTFGSWCWIGELYDVDVARDEFDLKDIVPDGEKYRDFDLKARLFENIEDMTPHDDRLRNKVMVKRLWVFPTNKNPKGLQVLYVNQKERRQIKDWWFPLTKYINLPFFDRPYGDTELRQCIPLQKSRNRARSSIQEYLRMMVKGKWLAALESKLGQSMFNSEHAEILFYNASAGPPPTQMQLQSLPRDIWQELAINDASMDDIFANRPSSQGKREAGINSGRQTALLQEEDDRAHTPGVSLYEEFWKGTYEKVLDCASKHYTTGKQIMVAGRDMEWEVHIINRGLDSAGKQTGEDMLGGRNRVMISLGSSLPTNKTMRRAMILENFEALLYGDPNDPRVKRKVLQQMGDGIVDDLYDDEKLDESMAVEENQRMMLNADGKIPEGEISPEVLLSALVVPELIDNHPVHIFKHKKAMKGWDFKRLHPALKEGMYAHLKMHEQMYMEQMQQELALQAQAANKESATAA
jgi:hypothetical protein